MKKIIISICIAFTVILSNAIETVQINGLTIKKIPGTRKNYYLNYNKKAGTGQVITITYWGKFKDKHKFRITKTLSGIVEKFTYHMKDGDKINFQEYTFRLIEFPKFFWFKSCNQ